MIEVEGGGGNEQEIYRTRDRKRRNKIKPIKSEGKGKKNDQREEIIDVATEGKRTRLPKVLH